MEPRTLRICVLLPLSEEEEKRMALVAHCYMALEKYFVLTKGKSLRMSAASRLRLHEEFKVSEPYTPWEVRKDGLVIKMNRYLAAQNLEPISGRLFQNIPVYLENAIRSRRVDWDAPHSVVWESNIRFFSHRPRIKSEQRKSLDADNPKITLRFSVADLGDWECDFKAMALGSEADLAMYDVADNILNIKFERPEKNWQALITLRDPNVNAP